MALDNGLQAFFEVIFWELHARLLELMLKHRLAFDDVLLTLLFLEPLADLGTRGVGLDYLKPVALGAWALLLGEYLYYIAALDLIVYGHDASVDLSTHHAVAYARMYRVSHIYDRRARGQIFDIALGSEYVDLVLWEVILYRLDDLGLIVYLALLLEHLSDPCQVLVEAVLPVASELELILPVSRDTVLGGMVHLIGAYLHLKGYTVAVEYGGMQTLIHIRLGGRYIILEAVG